MLALALLGLICTYLCVVSTAIENYVPHVVLNWVLLFMFYGGFAVLGALAGSILCLCKKVPRSVVIWGAVAGIIAAAFLTL